MAIRQASEADVVQISELVKSLAHYYLDELEAKLPAWLANTLTDQAFFTRITSSAYVNFVYEKQGVIIGYIAIKKPNHLYHLFVSEQFQGNGISRLLWEYVISNGQYSSFTLRSSIYAIPIYKKFGFIESGSIGKKDGVSFQPMELKINANQ